MGESSSATIIKQMEGSTHKRGRNSQNCGCVGKGPMLLVLLFVITIVSTIDTSKVLQGSTYYKTSVLQYALGTINLKTTTNFSLSTTELKVNSSTSASPPPSSIRSISNDSRPSTTSFEVEEKTMKENKVGGYCDGKDGILLIEGGDGEAAVGTLFFMYTVNHLIYADQNNLAPWIHMRPAFPCYDAAVHGNYSSTFTVLKGSREGRIKGTDNMTCMYWRSPQPYPGPVEHARAPEWTNMTLVGNGLWPSYFEPLSSRNGGYVHAVDDPSCRNKTVLILNKRSVFPGIHVCAPWAVRPWPVPKTPTALTPEGQQKSYHDWLGPMRERGAEKVRNYFSLLPWMAALVREANPSSPKCVSLHIRLTDKGHGRRKQPLELFQSYAEAYVAASNGGSIFIATDDGTILDTIRTNWNVSSTQIHSQSNVIRSSGREAIFRKFQNETHRTNTEGLVDMYAMSKCDFFVHGYSAMAEATVYLHPELHNQSVNVDATPPELIAVPAFFNMVREYYDYNTTRT